MTKTTTNTPTTTKTPTKNEDEHDHESSRRTVGGRNKVPPTPWTVAMWHGGPSTEAAQSQKTQTLLVDQDVVSDK
jgi:hypothetical protein